MHEERKEGQMRERRIISEGIFLDLYVRANRKTGVEFRQDKATYASERMTTPVIEWANIATRKAEKRMARERIEKNV